MTVVGINDRRERLNKNEALAKLVDETVVVEKLIASLKKIERYLFSIDRAPEVIPEMVSLKARKRLLINKQIRLGSIL